MQNQIQKTIILVSESDDKSTENVMDWLFYYKKEVIRKNTDLGFVDFNIHISSIKTTNSLSNNIIWNRRGYLPIMPIELKKSVWGNYLKKEQMSVLESFETSNHSNYIGSYIQEVNVNKLFNLQKAVICGLKIPDTLTTNNKNDLLDFVKENKRYITKSLYQTPNLENKDFIFRGDGTIEFDFNSITETFAPSLVQEYIEKEVEIRVFFIEDNYYAMAIFSQNDEKTKIDFRNYNNQKPNRNVPFLLPNEILEKLKKFTKIINCNTGSIDLILTPEGQFVFLEINPMGQYHWLSENCNYYIDKNIAEILIQKSQNE